MISRLVDGNVFGRKSILSHRKSVNFQGGRFSVPTKYFKFTLSNGVSRWGQPLYRANRSSGATMMGQMMGRVHICGPKLELSNYRSIFSMVQSQKFRLIFLVGEMFGDYLESHQMNGADNVRAL